MASKVRVYGKAQNRTALGIINAYQVMFPHATFEDFEKAFPKELNPDSGWPVNFKRQEECKTDNEKGFWFIENDEVVNLQKSKPSLAMEYAVQAVETIIRTIRDTMGL